MSKKLLSETTEVSVGGFKNLIQTYDDGSVLRTPVERYLVIGFHGSRETINGHSSCVGTIGFSVNKMLSMEAIKDFLNNKAALDHSFDYEVVSVSEFCENDYNALYPNG